MKLTKADIEKIEEEINYRKGELRQELLSNLKAARAQGDLSENFVNMIRRISEMSQFQLGFKSFDKEK